ncbi:hypothetical protein [Nocardiopsis sp. TNDT3]|uniref:hypothetical protein n=1 Tax=Nocardiopsis sp. TNDT3 TaxID=2249354 RepID=UPI000E3C3E88|nr:hypothetical protein [Nocardiopsis sp. TNDT3]
MNIARNEDPKGPWERFKRRWNALPGLVRFGINSFATWLLRKWYDHVWEHLQEAVKAFLDSGGLDL